MTQQKRSRTDPDHAARVERFLNTCDARAIGGRTGSPWAVCVVCGSTYELKKRLAKAVRHKPSQHICCACQKEQADEIVKLFVNIKGVGEWTVQMYLILALGPLDVLAPNDLGVREGVMKLYGLEEMPTPKQVKNLAEKWHPLETVGTVLAWRVLESE